MKKLKKLLTVCLIFMMLFSHLNITRIVADDEEPAGNDTTAEITEEPADEGGDDVYEVSDEGGDYSVEYLEKDDVSSVVLEGKAAKDASFAKDVVLKETSLTEDEVDEITDDVFALRSEDDDEYERMDEYSQIEAVSIKWVTEDSEGTNDQDPLLLSVVPFDDTKQSVRLQVNYSFSGEFDYLPGDITIKIPASIFKGRNDENLGSVTLPFALYPSTKNDFNYQLVGDYYIFTNTKGMSAATKGYFQVAFTNLYPHDLVDEKISEPFNAYIQIVTHGGNTIAARTDSLRAVFDTHAEIEKATKKLYGSVTRVDGSDLPDDDRIDPDEEYIQVKWYMWAEIDANTKYTLDLHDFVPADYEGFILNATSEDGYVYDKDKIYEGWQDGKSRYYYVTVLYPSSQFEPDTRYTFKNNAKFTLTETDKPSNKTEAEAHAETTWSYRNPVWHDPEGHYNIFKNGNDGSRGNYATRKANQSSTRSDTRLNTNGYYGIYASALNELNEGSDVDISYTINSVAYIMPWTYKEVIPGTYHYDDEGQFVWDIPPARIIGNYYQRPVTIISSDEGVCVERRGEMLVPGTDYKYVSVEFLRPKIFYGNPENIKPDGSWEARSYDDGTFSYKEDTDRTHYPEITLEILRNGQWEKYGTAYWGEDFRFEFVDESEQTSTVVPLPADVESFRTIITFDDPEKTNAAIDYDVRPTIRLLHESATLQRIVAEGFASSNTPETAIWNMANLYAYRTDTNEKIIDITEDAQGGLHKDGYDSIRGYTTDTEVYPSKSASVSNIDYDNAEFVINYSAKVEIKSYINDKDTWDQATADGRINPVRHGFWYDLLPKGASIDLSSIRLRSGDSLINAYTVEDYMGSGRTLLVVEADLKPVAERYRYGDIYCYQDVPKISFKVHYSFVSYEDYGELIHNVIAFEADRNTYLGTVEDRKAEPDNPYSNNNIATHDAFINDTERDYMKDLDKSEGTEYPVFVYAGVNLQLDKVDAGRTSLQKEVDVNHEDNYTSGVYYGNPDNARDVSIGGTYTYRLRMSADTDTITKDIIFYDALETFVPSEGNDEADVGQPSWQGYFRYVDLRQLTDKGCAPVVYYSKVNNLQLSDETDPSRAHLINTDLTNQNGQGETIWIRADQYNESLDLVHAIAIDCSKDVNGDDFILAPDDSLVVFIHMEAPATEEATALIEDSILYAYNNAYLLDSYKNTMYEEGDFEEDFVRKDYTKVGLLDYEVSVKKIWDDDDNRDGIRPIEPESVAYDLYANGVKIDEVFLPMVNEEDGSLIWEYTFKHLPYFDDEYKQITYTVDEIPVEGYEKYLDKPDVNEFVFTNVHIPEKITKSGEKIWEGDTPESRPEQLTIELYADGVLVKRMNIKADKLTGDWTYEFKDLYKYRHEGIEIEYTVKEIVTSVTSSYLDPVYNGLDIINVYHPYGDLYVKKTVDNFDEISDVARYSDTETQARKTFTFTFYFTRIVDGEEAPVLETYEYDIIDLDTEDRVGGGSVEYGDSITIRHNEQIHIKEVDQYIDYEIVEGDLPAGYSFVTSTNATGTIRPNDSVYGEIVNTYSASGKYAPEAEKRLYDQELKRYQFFFEMYEGEVTREEIENNSLKPIRSAANIEAKTETDDDDVILYYYAPLTFGSLSFTGTDDGKTFTYTLLENLADEAGYVYDERLYYVELEVNDNGDGTLEILPTYYRVEENGSRTEVNLTDVVFENHYKAEGSISLLAWKELKGRKLEDEEFTFELLDAEGNLMVLEVEDGEGNIQQVPQIKNNNDKAVVSFDQIKYDQDDIGKTFYYLVHEIKGDDETVIYDESYFGYKVTVEDYGNGTLKVVSIPVEVNVSVTGGEISSIVFLEETEELPVFVNTLEDGGLKIAKYISDDSEGHDPAQEFRFKVKLIGEDIKDGVIEYELTETDHEYGVINNTSDDGNDPDTGGNGGTPQPLIVSMPDPVKLKFSGMAGKAPTKLEGVFHATDDMLIGHAYIVIDSNSDGIVFRSEETYENGSNGEFTDINGNTYTGTIYDNVETVSNWNNRRWRAGSFKVAEGQAIKPVSLNALFNEHPGLKSVDLTGVDTSLVTGNLTGLFALQDPNDSLQYFKGSNLDLSGVTNINGLFYSCISLKTVDLSSTDLSNCTNFSQLFQDCWSLTYVDFSGVDTTAATKMGSMFQSCNKLEKITLGQNFAFNGNGITADYNKALLPDPPVNDQYTGLWVLEDDIAGTTAKTAEGMRDAGTVSPGTWVWQEKVTAYVIVFIGGEDAIGLMDPVKADPEADVTLPKNRFIKYGYSFDHWEDGAGNEYEDGETIPADTFEVGDVLTLTAVFVKKDTSVEIKDGEFEIVLHDHEMAIFDDIPAGTAYQVYELTPEGWVLIRQSNASGVIEPLTYAQADFMNRYQPDIATAQIYATKLLDNKAAEENSFSFELLDEDGNVVVVEDFDGNEVEQIKPVISGGFVLFDIITYSKDDVGTHTYTIREVDPESDEYDYDTHTETVTVTVTENEETGTLSAKVEYDEDGAVFRNKTRPGILKIEKIGEGVNDSNKDDIFHFQVTFTNANGLPLGEDEKIYWYIDGASPVGEAGKKAVVNINNLKASGFKPEVTADVAVSDDETLKKNAPVSALKKTVSELRGGGSKAGVFEATADMLTGTAYAVLTGEGELILFRSTETYEAGEDQTVTDIKGNPYTGKVYTGIETNNNNPPWSSDKDLIYSVRIAADQAIKPLNTARWFYNEANLASADLARLDTSSVTNMTYMFSGCTALTSLDLSGFNTSRVTNMSYMFSGCRALASLDVSNFNTLAATSMASMFSNCNALTSLDVSSFKTANVTNMSSMFSGCSTITSLDLSGFNTAKVTNMTLMFSNCAAITSLDLSSFNTAKVTNMSSMFMNCHALKSVDVSGFDTSLVTNMCQMFYYCENLERLDLSNFNTSNVANSGGIYYGLERMFSECKSLEYLDISNFDLTHLTGEAVYYLFRTTYSPSDVYYYQGYALKTIIIGEYFRFPNSNAAFPNPPTNAIYNGYWVRLGDDSGNHYTASSLVTDYTSEMAGIWVWETRSFGVLHFDGNGGYVASGDQTRAVNEGDSIVMPSAERPNYVLKGWNTEPDGSGTQYELGHVYDSSIISANQTLTLYAQWAEGEVREYIVEHYQQGESMADDDYELVDSERLSVSVEGTEEELDQIVVTVTPEVKTYEGFISPETQSLEIPRNAGLPKVIYKYAREAYLVRFDGNGASSGMMTDQKMAIGLAYKLKSNLYGKTGSLFLGWNTEADGSGVSYTDGQSVRDLSTEVGAVVTLYAQWAVNDNEVSPTYGTIDVYCKAGDTIIIPDLPAGTTYTVTEVDVPDGWEFVSIENDSGIITSNTIALVKATNKYVKHETIDLDLYAHKFLKGGDLEEGQFEFVLETYDGDLLQVVTNSEVDTYEYIVDEEGETVENPWYGSALVTFPKVRTYTEEDVGKTERFVVSEQVWNTEWDPTINYAANNYIVTVKVLMNEEGKLYLDISQNGYNPLTPGASDMVFTNKKKPGDLLVHKIVKGDENDTFTFSVEFFDQDGNPLEGEFSYRKYEKNESNFKYHSDNIDEEGNMLSEYPASYGWVEDWKTLENTDSVHIKAKFGGNGSMLMFGEGGEPYFECEDDICEVEFDLPPELYYEANQNAFYLPFVYTNQGAGGYGYYLDITASCSTTTGTGTISSGDTFTLKGDEYILIKDLPAGVSYKVKETDTPVNWTLVSAVGDTGTILSDETNKAEFTNRYEYVPQEIDVELVAFKAMNYGYIEEDDNYGFVLEDEEGNVIDTRFTDEYTNEDEEIFVGQSAITFDSIHFTEDDIGTYTYFIYERAGQDPDMVYDETRYKAVVTVAFNENHKLVANIVYYKLENGEDVPVSQVRFVNEKYTYLTLRKIVYRWEDSSPVTFVFEVEAKYNGEILIHEITSMTFDSTGGQRIRYEHLPAGTEVTIKELYAGGSYSIQEGSSDTQTIVLKYDDPNEITFVNGYNDGRKRGYGAKNSFSKDDEGKWIWESDLEEGGDDNE